MISQTTFEILKLNILSLKFPPNEGKNFVGKLFFDLKFKIQKLPGTLEPGVQFATEESGSMDFTFAQTATRAKMEEEYWDLICIH